MAKKLQKVLIVGAGATGLAAAYELQKRGIDVVIVEKATELGGLAGSLHVQGEPIERFYHHIFASDTAAIRMIDELGLSEKLHFYPSNNAIFYDESIHAFSTPLDMLRFPAVSFWNRLRFACSSVYIKLTGNWRALEKQLALPWLRKWAGKAVTDVIWGPLIRGKFGEASEGVPMSWLWARVHYRTFKLGYMQGGFQQIYDKLASNITRQGGTLLLGKGINHLQGTTDGAQATLEDGTTVAADAALVTVSEPLFASMTKTTLDPAKRHAHLGATCFVLELDRSLIPYYWLNINDLDFPFLAVVEHTRMVGTAAYGGKHVVYVGNYVPHDDWRYTTDPAELLQKYLPYLQRLNPNFDESWVTDWHFSKAPYTQPVVTRDYAAKIPPHRTAVPNVWLANMAQIYPQDRGQNYAFAMAQAVVADMADDQR